MDYTVTYTNNINAGKAALTVKGIGKFEGEKTIEFDIVKADSKITLKPQTKVYNKKTLSYNQKVSKKGSKGKVVFEYYKDASCKKRISASKVKNAGTYYVVGKLAQTDNYNAAKSKPVKFIIKKAKNPMAVKAVKRGISYSKLKKKNITLALPVKVSKAVGKVTYKKAGGKLGFSINKNNGKITVKKGSKKGKYIIKIKVSAKGNNNYNGASKTVKCQVVIK